MGHEVDLDITGQRVVPVAEGAHRHRAAHRRTHAGATALTATRHNAHLRQQPVHRGRADRQQLAPQLVIHIEPAMSLQGRQQDGDHRLQAL